MSEIEEQKVEVEVTNDFRAWLPSMVDDGGNGCSQVQRASQAYFNQSMDRLYFQRALANTGKMTQSEREAWVARELPQHALL